MAVVDLAMFRSRSLAGVTYSLYARIALGEPASPEAAVHVPIWWTTEAEPAEPADDIDALWPV